MNWHQASVAISIVWRERPFNESGVSRQGVWGELPFNESGVSRQGVWGELPFNEFGVSRQGVWGELPFREHDVNSRLGNLAGKVIRKFGVSTQPGSRKSVVWCEQGVLRGKIIKGVWCEQSFTEYGVNSLPGSLA